MKKSIILTLLLFFNLTVSFAQSDKAEIKFDKTVVDLGTFSENEPVRKCVFTFTNVGTQPLIINTAVASCGCTVPSYTKEPIQPGKKGQIKVTYNGTGKFPGRFKKSITVRTNGATEMTRLYVEGVMEEAKAK
jgi:P pilus assembly chaperone PapD